MSEKFNVAWQSFMSHGKDMLRQIMETQKYSDVTLVTDDQQQFNTHKFILSACSSVFKDIFDKTPANSTIYLRGIQHKELEAILQFVYLGKATIYQERLKIFLNVTKDLNIKEIGDVVSDDAEESMHEDVHEENQHNSDDIQENGFEDLEKEEKVDFPFDRKTITGIASFHCDVCDKNFSTKSNLTKHNRAQHLKISFPCQQCDYSATQAFNLKIHVQSQHKGTEYQNPQFSYKATSTEKLKTHLKIKHLNESN